MLISDGAVAGNSCPKKLKVREVQCQALPAQLPAPLPVDMKKGMRNLPLSTRARRFCRVLPSNGRAPHTSTYSTTPRLCPKQTLSATPGTVQIHLWAMPASGTSPQEKYRTGSRDAALEAFLWKTLFAASGLFSKTCTEHSGSKAKQTEQK